MEQQRNSEAPLVPTNEKLCIAAQNGDEEAANLLLERNVKFVKLVVRAVLNLFGIKPRDIGISYDDLVSEGQLGMWKCIAKYDPTQPANFLTYAKPSVRHSVTDLVRERLRETESQRTRITFEEVENRYAEGQRYTVWGDLPEMPEVVGDPFRQSPEQIYIEKDLIIRLYRALGRIDDRGRSYLRYRYGFEDGDEHSLAETADHFMLTESLARSAQKTALNQMRREMVG